ncbi:CoA transferase [Aquibium sp. A9E412]|uniref:CaiB/BaiF CoA transferase family protein n=1 Tax=Aquibium sp. A9E412 TaxID=2976767 RepID=UPI0025B2697E|nr:CaiB/BaiF CoA-transferase family protein [Aquibium sp. A9E412]MDN2568311.1 CoA transferase [Aquibium sp. A9E412]
MTSETTGQAANPETGGATPQSGTRKGPLTGVRAIEVGQLLAGPFVGSRLADFGAEVIKVEPPVKGDPMRQWGHHRYNGHGLWWPTLARNKKSVTADLRNPRGRELVRRLAADADALIENFKPGTLEKWELGPEALHAVNPRLVIVRVSGFGQTGPSAGRPGFASVGEAMGGIRYINGFPDQPPPRFGISLGDTLTAMFAFEGLMMALYWRDAGGGGKGQVVDAAIVESCFSMLESTLPEYDKCGVVRQPSGTGLPNVAPSNIYQTSDGAWMVIAANIDPMFRRLCKAMGQPELADDPRFVSHIARGENMATLDGMIGEWTRTMTKDELTVVLEEHGVVCGPIYSIADIAADPHFQARDMIVRRQDERFGDIAVPGVAPKLSETPGDVAWLGAEQPGKDNDEIYGEVLGIGADELADLRDQGII